MYRQFQHHETDDINLKLQQQWKNAEASAFNNDLKVFRGLVA